MIASGACLEVADQLPHSGRGIIQQEETPTLPGVQISGQSALSPVALDPLTIHDAPKKGSIEQAGGDTDYPKFNDMPRVVVALILFSLGLSSFLFAIEQTIVATSIAGIGSALNIKQSLTWITTSYLLTTTVFQPITGRLADAVGARRLLIIAIWVFIIGNVVAGSSHGFAQLVAGRLLSGIGGAGLLSLSTILLSQLTHERQRGSYLNLINAVFTVADAVGPTVGGALTQSGNWRWIFLLNAPFGPIITFILLKSLRLPPAPGSINGFRATLAEMDILGMCTLIATLTFLVIGLNMGGQELPWGSPTIIGMFCAAAVAFLAFILAENRAARPVAPMHLFIEWKWRNVPIIMVARSLLFFHLFATTFYLPILLQVTGINNVTAGALVIPFLLTAAVSSTFSGYICSKYGHVRPLFMLGLVVLPVGMALMSMLNERSGIPRVVGYSVITGYAFGSGTLTSVVIAQVGLPAEVLATVTALVSSLPNLGGVLGVGIIGTIINNTFRAHLLRTLGANALRGLDLNDPVALRHVFPEGPMRDAVVGAYVRAWRTGCHVLAGIAVAQFLMCIFIRPVTLDDGGADERKGYSGAGAGVEAGVSARSTDVGEKVYPVITKI